MAPTYVKGGAWTNVEDEILKAAVSKYGLNQWARVASLLARKSTKQAKARWQEYLDPRIRKTEWTSGEDERLLILSRLMPNQWRSIAESVGRTATHCIERYQQLLEDSENVSSQDQGTDLSYSGPGIETLETIGGSKDIHIGDFNIDAESKEARPDAIDLDEDEKEMLSEARARLANTQGKKASRKQRERMLIDSKRIALLQKRRELKQAGINTKLSAPKKKFDTQMDYNADIPYEHRPIDGFYDTTHENEENFKKLESFQESVKRIGVKEDRTKNHGEKRKKEDKATSFEKSASSVNLNPTKKRKLVLPQPTFNDDELKELSGKSKEEYLKIVAERNEVLTTFDDKISGNIQRIKEFRGQQSALLTTDEPEKTDHIESPLKLEETTEPSGDTKRKSKTKEKNALKIYIRLRLSQLPAPKNDFELLDSEDEEIEVLERLKSETTLTQDEGEKERLRLALQKKERAKALLRRSQAVQKELPIPNIQEDISLSPSLDQSSDRLTELIRKEMVSIIRSDYAKSNNLLGFPIVDDLDEKSLKNVKHEMQKYLNDSKMKDFLTEFDQEYRSKHFNPDVKFSSAEYNRQLTRLETLIKESDELEHDLEKDYSVFIETNERLAEETESLMEERSKNCRALAAFEMLYNNEKIVLPLRQQSLQEQADQIGEAQRVAQERYLKLTRTKENTT